MQQFNIKQLHDNFCRTFQFILKVINQSNKFNKNNAAFKIIFQLILNSMPGSGANLMRSFKVQNIRAILQKTRDWNRRIRKEPLSNHLRGNYFFFYLIALECFYPFKCKCNIVVVRLLAR